MFNEEVWPYQTGRGAGVSVEPDVHPGVAASIPALLLTPSAAAPHRLHLAEQTLDY